ncbi:MAG: YeiH family protein [Steroidobacterales bacterium]
MNSTVFRFLPGILLCAAVTMAAIALQFVEVRATGQPYLESLVLAILIGVAVRSAWVPGARFLPGIYFCAKWLLEIAVMLLGASVSVYTVLKLGPAMLLGIFLIVAVAICTSYLIGRALGLPQRMAILIACGNSICGNSAIVAVAPVIGASASDVSSAIAFTAVLGVVVVLGLPLLVPVFGLSLPQYGFLAGMTVYAVPQVIAATLPIGELSNQVGTLVKLVRVLTLAPVVLAMALFARRLPQEGPAPVMPKLHRLVPWFIVPFLLMGALRTFNLIPTALLEPIVHLTKGFTTISMAALGLGVNVRVIAKTGLSVSAAVILSLLVLGGITMVLIRLVST